MPQWGNSTTNEAKPKWLRAFDASRVYATARGWVLQHLNGIEELLVPIANLDTKLGEPNITEAFFANTVATYVPAANGHVGISFNERVRVTGTPTLVISSRNNANVTSNVTATYVSGNNTNRLLFRFAVPAGANQLLSIPAQTVVTGVSNNIVDLGNTSVNAVSTLAVGAIRPVQLQGNTVTVSIP